MDTQTPNTTNPAADAEVIIDIPEGNGTPNPTAPSDQSQNSAQVLIDLESLIKNHITGIDTRKTELKKYKDMVASTLDNDATYREHAQKAKEAAKLKSATKAQIMKLPQNATIQAKVVELTGELKDMEGALSDYLREYARMSGTNEIEGDDGEVREIVYIAKLIKKASQT